MANAGESPILIVGTSRDPTYLHTVGALEASGHAFYMLDIDAFCRGGSLSGSLADPNMRVLQGGSTWNLNDFRSCYARFVDLPVGWDSDAERGNAQALQLAIASLSIPVINKPTAGESNSSKPYQTALLHQAGFVVPRSLSTNSHSQALAFIESCKNGVIYKSNSSNRSIVVAFLPRDQPRLGLLRKCPVFFQERIQGTNVRVHVLRDKTFSVQIRSEDVDYRYDPSPHVTEGPHALPEEIADKCVAITRDLGLVFSGIDLVVGDDDGEYYCLEVNPMPGYHGYDLTLGGAISQSLCAELADESGPPATMELLPALARRTRSWSERGNR